MKKTPPQLVLRAGNRIHTFCYILYCNPREGSELQRGGQHRGEEEHVPVEMSALAASLAVQLGAFYTGQCSFLGEGQAMSSSFRGCIQQHTTPSESLLKWWQGRKSQPPPVQLSNIPHRWQTQPLPTWARDDFNPLLCLGLNQAQYFYPLYLYREI